MKASTTLVPLTENRIPLDYKMIQKNEAYLESFGEGYPNIKNTNDYFLYLLRIYGDFQNIELKRFTICHEDKPCGQIGLHSFCIENFTCQAEIFYWIDEQFQGKGIVTRACQQLQKHAFEVLGLDLLIIHCQVENIKSANVALRCGFNYEGISNLDNTQYKKFIKTLEQYQKEIIN
ncbi:unnamed protein product [Paramecium pentaurelia]|uniref:N-acetyltransferase domain-containing protein n=1 Tax=Paramecium pentaurelia TaxID=43138 RepID=A0A8S1TQ56_9CILI|nr:unnamed protein product [Paramecium pentaurelia]